MSTMVETLSTDLAELVERTDPGVVRVEGRRRLAGSGVVWSQGGAIVTAHHVLERDHDLQVGLHDGTKVAAELIGRDPTTDLAVLKPAGNLDSDIRWDAGERLQVGHLVMALGRPRQRVQATLGIVSALGEAWRTPMGGQVDRYMQTDVVMYPGFSGGPLVGASGTVLGMNTSALLRGVSLTLPLVTVQRVVGQLLEHGSVRRGYLGVAAQPVELPGRVADELVQSAGLLLVTVEPDSPAEAAGLAMGDTIVAAGGEPTQRLRDLLSALEVDQVGKELELKLLRAGELTSRTVTVGERPE
ncbi:MAG: trypsin-like peptidase domain-containing protein [Anaerolineales bacterium]